jgi:hypothetical protein
VRDKMLVVQSLAVSALAHGVLILWAMGMRLPGVNDSFRREPYFFNVRITKELEQDVAVSESIVSPPIESLRFSDVSHDSFVERIAEKELSSLSTHEKDFLPIPPLEDDHNSYDQSQVLPIPPGEPMHSLLEQKDRRPTMDYLVENERLVGDVDAEEALGLPDEDVFVIASSDSMPGVTPGYIGFGWDESALDGGMSSGGRAGDDFWTEFQPVVQSRIGYASTGEILVWNVRVYRSEKEPYLYFKIGLRINPSLSPWQLPSISKEVVFLVDNSWSMEQRRVDEFKDGLTKTLARLNEGDYFNIIVFKEGLISLAPRSIEANDRSIEQAVRFVDRVTTGGKTDTYQALYQTLGAGSVMTPSYLILFSDGRPTQGITDSTRLISDISRFNNGRVAIFSFSGGLRTNRYLLDFIAYRNRGWAEHSNRAHRIGNDLGLLYDKIRHPVLINLRYQVSGVDKEHLYPKVMPDVFRNTEMVFYGRVQSAGDLVLRLVGEMNRETVELIINGDLSQAEDGGRDIAEQWALHRAYDLISQLDDGRDTDALKEELEGLVSQFGVKIPYWTELF